MSEKAERPAKEMLRKQRRTAEKLSIPRIERHIFLCCDPTKAKCCGRKRSLKAWKFLRKRALSRWHKTFEAMQAAVSGVLDHLSDYRKELDTLMTENFHIVAKESVPAEYREVA